MTKREFLPLRSDDNPIGSRVASPDEADPGICGAEMMMVFRSNV